MKKSIAIVAMAFGVTSAFAQDLTSKKGEPMLPEAGDWSIGIDATPFLNYAGNFFGKTGPNVAPTFNNYGLNQTIVGKYFTDASNAYRGILRLGMINSKQKQDIAKYEAPGTGAIAAISEANTPVFDQYNSSTRNIALGVGIEKRKGKTRLQGIYGADFFVWGGSKKEKYKYGNALTQSDNATTAFNENLDATNAAGVTNFGSNITTTLTGYQQVSGARATKVKTGGNIGVGLRGFIGVEYFILPKISLGGEFGWGIGYQVSTKDKSTWEAEGTGTAPGATQEVKTVEVKDKVNGGSKFVLDTDRNAANSATYNLIGGSGTLRLNFYF